MKLLSFAVLIVTTVMAQAITFSSLATLSLTLVSFKPVSGFFGFFRRRSNKPSVVEEMSQEGPVNFMPPAFQQSGFFNPLAGGNRGGFFQGFGNMPNFPASMSPSSFRPQAQPSWSQNSPAQPSWSQNAPQPQSAGFQPQDFGQDFGQNADSQSDFDRDVRFDDQPQINTEEAESFFTLLAETDENKCISRLVCEMGADPSTAGELGTTISEIIGSLTDFPDGSKVLEYNQVLENGRTRGSSFCKSRFSSCDEESYGLMKNSQAEDSEPDS